MSESRQTGNEIDGVQADADDAALLHEIYRELGERPPFTCPVTYSWSRGESEAQQVTNSLAVWLVVLRRQHPWLDFNRVEGIIFHHDYDQALRDLGERTGRPCEATKEASGTGVSMVVHLDSTCVVVAHESIAAGLLDDASDEHRATAVDLLLHEFCHVHDFAHRHALAISDSMKDVIAGARRYFFPAADAAWSEYFANKYSHTTMASRDDHPKMLADVVPEVSEQIRAATLAYRTTGKVDELAQLAATKVAYMFQCFGYAAGRLHALGESLNDVAPLSAAALRKAGIEDVWDTVCAELLRLDADRDSWASFAVYDRLMDAVDQTLQHLGLHFSTTPQGVHVRAQGRE